MLTLIAAQIIACSLNPVMDGAERNAIEARRVKIAAVNAKPRPANAARADGQKRADELRAKNEELRKRIEEMRAKLVADVEQRIADYDAKILALERKPVLTQLDHDLLAIYIKAIHNDRVFLLKYKALP